ncbi:MAG: hypothetical protein AAFU50_00055, partial [Pseudomonadota bacterium]
MPKQILSVGRVTMVAAVSVVAGGLALASVSTAHAQNRFSDSIGDLIERQKKQGGPSADGERTARAETKDNDPRAGDPTYEQAKRLMQAIDRVLKDAADGRNKARKLPSKNDFLVPPIWSETKEDREQRVRELLDAALAIVTDVPVVEYQKTIESRRRAIRKLEDEIVSMKEKRLDAPEGGLLPGVLSDTVESLNSGIREAEKRIDLNRQEIENTKAKVREALRKSGLKLDAAQVDLLLDSVLANDLVKLVAVFESAKLIDRQLARRMNATGENTTAARKYFAMHAALFAMLVHAQDTIVGRIDEDYLPKLSAIGRDLRAAREKTKELLRRKNRADQRRVLEANLESQRLAEDAARGYRKYLLQQ